MSEITNFEANSGSFNQSANVDEKIMQKTIKALQDFISDEEINSIEEIFKQFNVKLETFEDYEDIVKFYGVLINVVDSFTVDGATHMDLKNEETVKQ
jgi:hypothetical protein